MKKISNLIVGLITTFFIIYGSYFLISKIFVSIKDLNPNVVASLIVALTAAFGFLYNQYQSKNREIQEIHRSKKVELYNEFMKMTFEFLNQYKQEKNNRLPKDFETKFMDFHRGLIIRGSPNVIQKYVTFRNSAGESQNSIQILKLVNELLLAIRKDLGNSNFMLKKGELLKIFINDPKEIERLVK